MPSLKFNPYFSIDLNYYFTTSMCVHADFQVLKNLLGGVHDDHDQVCSPLGNAKKVKGLFNLIRGYPCFKKNTYVVSLKA